jgi:hypothetical protein
MSQKSRFVRPKLMSQDTASRINTSRNVPIGFKDANRHNIGEEGVKLFVIMISPYGLGHVACFNSELILKL